ncbi:MAG: STAS domain-containing protein [Spirochaetaceae bacterium]|nr:STAS domain-containing protein [Spirochaetaceae bacterium]
MTTTQNRSTIISITLDKNPDLKLSLEDAGSEGAIIIRLAGLIDTYNADFFRNQAIRVVEAGYRNIIIDATATTFMSSTGIGAFTALLKTIRQKQGSMIIFGMPARIFEVFQLLGFTTFFQFCATRDEALGMLNVDSSPVEVFPVLIVCPVCNRRLKAVKAGRFRCSSCRVILMVDKEGETHLG